VTPAITTAIQKKARTFPSCFNSCGFSSPIINLLRNQIADDRNIPINDSTIIKTNMSEIDPRIYIILSPLLPVNAGNIFFSNQVFLLKNTKNENDLMVLSTLRAKNKERRKINEKEQIIFRKTIAFTSAFLI